MYMSIHYVVNGQLLMNQIKSVPFPNYSLFIDICLRHGHTIASHSVMLHMRFILVAGDHTGLFIKLVELNKIILVV